MTTPTTPAEGTRVAMERILAAADVCPTCGQKRVADVDDDLVGSFPVDTTDPDEAEPEPGPPG